ncbi:MAG: lysophospholipid acyltransferase family protein [Sphaerochaetaceae bacterium]
MKYSERFVNALLRGLFHLLFRLDTKALDQLPHTGPALMIVNHTSNFEGPMIYVFSQPRKMVALAKKQLWDHWITGFLMNLWHSIPVDRENMGRESMDQCFEVLERGELLAIAPEGTRSKDGTLQEGKAGVAFIAYRKQVPLLPIVTLGFERFSQNIKHLRRTPITIKVGKPFEIIQKSGRLDAITRQALVDEIMLRLAELMPPDRWGFYQNRTLDFKLTRSL